MEYGITDSIQTYMFRRSVPLVSLTARPGELIPHDDRADCFAFPVPGIVSYDHIAGMISEE